MLLILRLIKEWKRFKEGISKQNHSMLYQTLGRDMSALKTTSRFDKEIVEVLEKDIHTIFILGIFNQNLWNIKNSI